MGIVHAEGLNRERGFDVTVRTASDERRALTMRPVASDASHCTRVAAGSSGDVDLARELLPHIRLIDTGDRIAVFLRDRLELRILPSQSRGRLWLALSEFAAGRAETARVGGAEGVAVAAGELMSNDGLTSTQAGADDRPTLDRLTLAVSNSCNLRCSYCYAQTGRYYSKKGLLMSRDVMHVALDRAARSYSRIEHVNFFGGEPTLNVEVIDSACAHVGDLYERGELLYRPSFGTATNGYALSPTVLGLLQRHNFSVTLSLDGPREIHDAKRRTPAGRGTYDAVAANAHRLLRMGLAVEFECTYTNEHLRRGMSIVDLMDFFHSEFGCGTLHCQIVSAAPSSSEFVPLPAGVRLLGDAIDASLANLATGTRKTISLAVRMLRSLSSGVPIRNYCPAGRREITVNADGGVYACFMLMQTREHSLGSVVNAPGGQDGKVNRTQGAAASLVHQEILLQDKYTNPACQRCWAQPLCYGCLGADLELMEGRIVRSGTPGQSILCDLKRDLVEGFLRSVEKAERLAA
ncbi:MAG: hypothetical protein C0505_02900 [Leptothrix sp. (in: Bacteria)]|nr:hypothetical protein [Leptothrix sp. (in: b-proteobacteria)]